MTAKRTRVAVRAGESTYTELGVDAGVAGAVAFVLWNLAVFVGLLRRESWLAAAFVAVLAIGLQTDVIGIHWIAFTVWAAAGLTLGQPRRVHGLDTSVLPPAVGAGAVAAPTPEGADADAAEDATVQR